jgi:hypothetical protein
MLHFPLFCDCCGPGTGPGGAQRSFQAMEIIDILIRIMTTMLRGDNYDGNDSYENNDNDDDAKW